MLTSISSVLVFSGMQMFKWWFNSSQLHTIVGGYLGSLLFVLFLTAIGNLETCLFGKSFQVKLFPEGKLSFCFLMTLLWFFFQFYFAFWWLFLLQQLFIEFVALLGKFWLYQLFWLLYVYFFSILLSFVALYYINKKSQMVYAQQVTPAVTQTGKKKRN